MNRSLVPPTSRLHATWLAGRDDWGRGTHQPGASLPAERLGLDLDDPAGFREWVEMLLRAGDPTQELPDGLVPATHRWIVEDGRYAGAIQFRHRLTPFLAELAGHIGYGIRPGARCRGLAGFALGQVLHRARRLGLDRVLVTCDDSNLASARVIERTGGVLENVREPDAFAREHGFDEPLRRYWIRVRPGDGSATARAGADGASGA